MFTGFQLLMRSRIRLPSRAGGGQRRPRSRYTCELRDLFQTWLVVLCLWF